MLEVGLGGMTDEEVSNLSVEMTQDYSSDTQPVQSTFLYVGCPQVASSAW